MRHYHLPEHLYFCEVDGARLFLDLSADRYFMLPQPADAAFSLLLGEDPEPAAAYDDLRSAGLIVTPPGGKPLAPTRHPPPETSLIEAESSRTRASLLAVAEVALLVHRARKAIARGRLPLVLADLSRRAKGGASESSADCQAAVRCFLAARQFTPIAPNCLHDSIALALYLQRRGFFPDLVIGAKLHPFGAHAWLQDGPVVLNDSLAVARGFTPVLVA